MNSCSRATCYAPDTGCSLGFLDRSKCPSWSGAELSGTEDTSRVDDVLMPWSARALGLVDAGFVAGRGKPFVVGIVGPENAGKTTLLASWFLLLSRGLASKIDRRFAGSYSFEGWETVAGTMRYHPGYLPQFPPHTSSKEGRAPGLLHLAFRHDADPVRSYLFADAPGEWFKKWAVDSQGPESAGAAWIAQHADLFLLTADRDALAGEHRGAARGTLQLIAKRLMSERRGRPLALVWTKADVSISKEMETAVRNAVFTMSEVGEFAVSVVGNDQNNGIGAGLLELLQWTLDCKRNTAVLPVVDRGTCDPLFMFGMRR
jgi:hypothetical protein